jgi:hypothetical protein
MADLVPDNSAVIVDNSDPSEDHGWAERAVAIGTYAYQPAIS